MTGQFIVSIVHLP